MICVGYEQTNDGIALNICTRHVTHRVKRENMFASRIHSKQTRINRDEINVTNESNKHCMLFPHQPYLKQIRPFYN